ncbi:MAG: LuxR family transcriptional regulator [Alphaproteobacteria bacterium]|nr:LuxR family transcriptional regulator [Alphaproteobacteria bacterium]
MTSIENHISTINAAGSPQDLFSRFVTVMYGYGYDKVSYGCATDCPSLGLKKRHGHISSFSEEWLKHYATNNLSEVDPVHIHLLEKQTPTFWSSCINGAAPSSIQLMRDAADVGLKSGISVPIFDRAGEISMVSVARNEPDHEERYEILAAVNLLSLYFYQSYKSFIKSPDPVKLSPREYGILSWASEGKTDSEIATLTNISVATVRYYWKRIFEKLGVYSRVYAVARAVQLRLINPQTVMKNLP